MHDHVKTRLTSVSIATSTNPTYAYHSYDKLPNLSLDHEYTRIALTKGLTIAPELANGIVVRCNNDSSVFGSIYIKQMVRNLCVSQ